MKTYFLNWIFRHVFSAVPEFRLSPFIIDRQMILFVVPLSLNSAKDIEELELLLLKTHHCLLFDKGLRNLCVYRR